MRLKNEEHIMNFMNVVSGARLHAALFSTSGVAYDLPIKLIEDITQLYTLPFLIEFHDVEELLTNNRICKVD
jgi:NADH dehydrogenase (ubiquinone) Fe-S protein 2